MKYPLFTLTKPVSFSVPEMRKIIISFKKPLLIRVLFTISCLIQTRLSCACMVYWICRSACLWFIKCVIVFHTNIKYIIADGDCMVITKKNVITQARPSATCVPHLYSLLEKQNENDYNWCSNLHGVPWCFTCTGMPVQWRISELCSAVAVVLTSLCGNSCVSEYMSN